MRMIQKLSFVSRSPILRRLASPLARILARPIYQMPETSHEGPLPPQTLQELELERACRRHIHELAHKIGPRYQIESLERAARYIESEFRQIGYDVQRQPFKVSLESGGKSVEMHNLEARLPGKEDHLPHLVIGAHYDTVPGSPGADDNASGIAALLELSRLLKAKSLRRSVRFVAFANEEHPGLPSESMGSYQYARQCWQRRERLGMLSLEMLGCYSRQPESQRYPFPFDLIFPETGDFIAFVGSTPSKALIEELIREFRLTTRFPSQGIAAPSWLPDACRSDHWGFEQFGYQALMVTDTANFRNQHYHQLSDTESRIDYESMSRVVAGLSRSLERICRHGRKL